MSRFACLPLLALFACASTPRAATTPLPTTAPLATTDAYAGRLAVRRWGRDGAPPLVLVHGLGENASRDFAAVGPALGRTHSVHALDLPGFGESEAAGHSFHPADYAALVATYVEREIGRPVALVGHSMGGAVAALVAGEHPEVVERLVLVDVAGVLHREAWVGSLAIEPVRAGGGAIPAGMMDTSLALVGAIEPDLAQVVARPALRGALLGDEPGTVAAVSLITTDLGPALAAIRAPTLLLWGARDRVAPLRTLAVLESRIAGARRVVLEDVGHVPMSEAPEAFVDAVRAHLAGVTPAAAAAPGAARDFTCTDRDDPVTLTGRYRRVVLEGCTKVTLTEARVASLVVRDSVVSLDRVVVQSAETALVAEDSEVRMTGGALRGAVAVQARHARFDFAGVRVEGTRDAFVIDDEPSRALFSVCPIQSGDHLVHAHGPVVLAAE